MSASRFGAPALERGLAILDALAESEQGLRAAELAELVALPRSSAFALVRALEGLGWVERDAEGRVRLGLRLLSLGAGVAHRLDVREAAATHLRELRERLELTIHLAVRAPAGGIVYVDKVDGPGFVRFDTFVGKHADAHLTAVGKALLATLDPEEVNAEIERRGLRRGTERSLATVEGLHEQLAEIRTRGFALEDQEEILGVRCVAVAIGGSRPAPASVGCIGLTSEIPDDRIEATASAVRDCAEAISREIGTSS